VSDVLDHPGFLYYFPPLSCEDCHLKYDYLWQADDAMWAQITPNTERPSGGQLCIPCATKRAADKGISILWRLEVNT
jgi:hypothetical protein